MIKRIVKLTFLPEKVTDFLQVFEESKAAIRGFEGCLHVELLQDVLLPNRFFTFSLWESEAALNLYRKSPLFEATWARTKVLFAEKAEAWSVVVAAE